MLSLNSESCQNDTSWAPSIGLVYPTLLPEHHSTTFMSCPMSLPLNGSYHVAWLASKYTCLWELVSQSCQFANVLLTGVRFLHPPIELGSWAVGYCAWIYPPVSSLSIGLLKFLLSFLRHSSQPVPLFEPKSALALTTVIGPHARTIYAIVELDQLNC